MSSLKQKYGNVKGRLTRARDFVNTITVEISLEMLEIRFKSLNETWSEFCAFYNEILEGLKEDNEELQTYETEFGMYESRYFDAHAMLSAAIRKKQSTSRLEDDVTVVEKLAMQQTTLIEKLNATSERCTIQLPKLVVPPFSGDYKDWPSFRDSFTGSVDQKENLTAVQKFYYLKSFLRDRALDLIKHIPLSEANYFEAWERLEHRYDRVQLIVQSFIETYLSLPNAIGGNVKVLRQISDTADEVIRGLNAVNSNGRDPWLIHLLLTKLDVDTKQSWAEKIGTRDDASIDEFLTFLETRCTALESCQTVASRSSVSRNKQQPNIRSHFVESSHSKPVWQCPKCQEQHNLPQCPKFVALDAESRRSFVKSNSLCFNCLRPGHGVYKCHSNFRCRECRSRHHSLVHPSSSSQNSSSSSSQPQIASHKSTPEQASSSSVAPIINNHSLDVAISRQTILPTILALVEDFKGNLQNCRILVDSGSQVSFVGESFVQRLGIPRKHARIPISGVSSSDAGYTKGVVSLTLISRFDKTSLVIDAYVMPKVTSNLPSRSFDPSRLLHIRGLELADPSFNSSGSIDILLGADKLWSILKGDQIRGAEGAPIAQHTSFGWVITGELFEAASPSVNQSLITSLHSSLDIDFLLKRFWELEEVVPLKDNCFDEDEAEIHFRNTFSRSIDGKYSVQLPFKSPFPVFGDSLKLAVNRLYSMEKRFHRDKALHNSYSNFMQEYLNLGHMTRIPSNEIHTAQGKHFYLPHHAVLKPDSSTTKLRVVFDGSARDSFGNSLNSQLLIGPPIQRDLFGVCLRFRQHKYVFTADVVKMFRQIWVEDEHTDFQRIVWRENPNDEIGHFRLRTVTYGTASAPFLSVRVLKQIANDYKEQYPNAARVLTTDVYVDDIMTGANSSEELMSLQSELVSLLSNAKLELRKWNSNCWPLLARLPRDDCEFSWFDADPSKTTIKVLGLHWSPTSDEFSFRFSNSRIVCPPTRRSLLSEISSIFDPLGFLAPSVILFKILFQELWSSELKLGWDDPLPIQLSNKWLTYRNELHFFEKLRIPRNAFPSFESVEYHGFSDASSVAYSAVVYARCKISESEYKTILIASKTKVAPLKPVSIPRLELCAALLLSRLLKMIRTSISIDCPFFAWCDSQVVLHWLSSPPRRWTTFVANRTAAILETIPRHAWNYIASESNPADCASRGILPSGVTDHPLWWSGPNWLSLPQDLWPKSNFPAKQSTENDIFVEEKQSSKAVALAANTDSSWVILLAERVSSWNRLIRVVATCIRYSTNLRPTKFEKRFDSLTFKEIHFARISVLKNIQEDSFGSDIKYLIKNHELPVKSKLLRYSPFIDKDGLLRVGGRLKHAYISFNLKHPIILPNNRVSFLIAEDIHNNHLHPGLSETFVIVRQRYWILGSRNLIRKIVSRCKTCFLQGKSTSQQLMGELPSHRVQPARPFTNTGCDYAGPFVIKLSKGRKSKLSKAYFAIFVCMSTKAIHLELVSDLTTDAFLAAFKRFVSRRGKCANMYSDNGTNFQGARRCLNEMQKLVVSQAHNEEIASRLAMDGTAWHFIPPSAPHFGGLWEAGVKSVKLHLRRVVGSSILTFEELYTVLTQIESILNSRPICVISDNDLNPLTPAHFLIGEPLTAVPEPSYLDIPTNRLSHWQHLQSMVQGFWKRWHAEYITSLQERPKWQRKELNLNIGDLVIIREPNLPPTRWILGRIAAVHPGSDDQIRVVTVKTANGTYLRPITKLAPLPKS
ncbi:uncharacterized protein LOC129945200 [Eupeodes corollae]|uniref:uncharacterized protein LOC129945200 n=1 Tax=Eupeodes corollae TaxID=290404 RepID=UPI00248F61B3|nr:uncharacterized protein LOC129945200 [Eupeodes corollae]